MLQANSVAIIVLAVPPRSIGKAVGFQGQPSHRHRDGADGRRSAGGGGRVAADLPSSTSLSASSGSSPDGCSSPAAATWPPGCPSTGWVSACSFPAVVLVLFGSPLGTRRAGSRPRSWLPWLLARPCSVASSSKSAVPTRRCSTSASSDARRSLSASRADSCPRLVLFGVLFVVPFYFERSLGLGAGRAGLELMAMPFALGVVAPYAGRSADRIGARPLTVVGMVLVCAGLVAMGLRQARGRRWSPSSWWWGSASACSRPRTTPRSWGGCRGSPRGWPRVCST